ncbi:TcpD family membrane protein [Viridibacillus sp. NPDC093762]|uniref:TcpD family membrane protein n=1 Tax=Viridibacillus sp. NPDC093762 TaxID=3390720 RepID=UPI003D01B345
MDFKEAFNWIKEQAGYGLMAVLLVVIIVCAAKRSWIAMIGSIVALAFIGIFVTDPTVITTLSAWLKGKIMTK